MIYMKTLIIYISFWRFTLIPVFVASLTASRSLSYFGLKVTVKAQSIILPARQKSQTKLNERKEIEDNKKKNKQIDYAVLLFVTYRPLMCVPKSILQTSSYCSTVVSPVLGV